MTYKIWTKTSDKLENIPLVKNTNVRGSTNFTTSNNKRLQTGKSASLPVHHKTMINWRAGAIYGSSNDVT